MAKTPGSGRKKGTPNKKSLDLEALCEAKGINVFEKLLEYLVYPCEPELRLQAIKEACKYLYPQRRAMEVSGGLDVTSAPRELEHVTDEDLEAVLIETLNAAKPSQA